MAEEEEEKEKKKKKVISKALRELKMQRKWNENRAKTELKQFEALTKKKLMLDLRLKIEV